MFAQHGTGTAPIQVNTDGELITNTEISGDITLDTGSLSVVDSEGHEWNVRSDSSGEVYITGQSADLATNTKLDELIAQVASSGDTIEVVNQVDRAWNLNDTSDSISAKLTNQDTDSIIHGRTSAGTDVIMLADTTGKQVILSQQDGTWTVKRDWSLTRESDTVGAYQEGSWTVSVDNQDTDVNITGQPLDVTPTDTNVVIKGKGPNGEELAVSTNDSGYLIVEQSDSITANVEGEIQTTRNWSLNVQEDTVNANIINKPDTSVEIAKDSIGLIDHVDTVTKTVKDTQPRKVVNDYSNNYYDTKVTVDTSGDSITFPFTAERVHVIIEENDVQFALDTNGVDSFNFPVRAGNSYTEKEFLTNGLSFKSMSGQATVWVRAIEFRENN
jgi:hypothetical protein